MRFDFDTPSDRRGTGSLKWDKYAAQDVIPMWVADMDFRSPPVVLQALRQCVEHGVFGYTVAPADVIEAVVAMCAERFDWHIEPDWLLWFPGLNTALTTVCRAFGEDRDEALVLPPVYPPLLLAAPRSRKRNVLSPLVLDGQRWVMDFAHMQKVLSPRTRMLLFCNPHNPVGRAYHESEVLQVAEFCERNDLLICSDDVHCDLLLEPGLQHRPLARLAPELARRTITLMAASKTYNLAGLHCAYAIVPDAQARERLSAAMQGVVAFISPLSYAATRAAYRDGEPWRAALLDYLRGNYRQVFAKVNACPGLQMLPMEATYLAWIDARQLPVADPVAFFEQGGIGLSDGRDFGSPGFVRLNFACPRGQLDTALKRIEDAVAAL